MRTWNCIYWTSCFRTQRNGKGSSVIFFIIALYFSLPSDLLPLFLLLLVIFCPSSYISDFHHFLLHLLFLSLLLNFYCPLFRIPLFFLPLLFLLLLFSLLFCPSSCLYFFSSCSPHFPPHPSPVTLSSLSLFCSVSFSSDHPCGLVVRVPIYRSRDPGSIPGATRFSEK
jgi:hypothetical protein